MFLIKLSLLLLFSTSLLAQTKVPVWMDTDPACGISDTDDVDDCWAMILAMNSSAISIQGVSTVYGNVSEQKAYQTLMMLKSRSEMNFPVYRGADNSMDNQTKSNAAVTALYKMLLKQPMTIIALGPLTNIALLIQQYPHISKNINQIIAVAGKRPDGALGFRPGNTHVLHVHDLNFRKDVKAFEVLFKTNIDLTLIPYEVASRVSIQSEDLQQIATANPALSWLVKKSYGWLDFWQQDLKATGFFPFDIMAVEYLAQPQLFKCENTFSKIQNKHSLFRRSRDDLEISNEFKNGRSLTYCSNIVSLFKQNLIQHIIN